jgi:hypothetical protein
VDDATDETMSEEWPCTKDHRSPGEDDDDLQWVFDGDLVDNDMDRVRAFVLDKDTEMVGDVVQGDCKNGDRIGYVVTEDCVV